MNISVYIARRLSLAGDRNESRSPSTLIAIIGVAVSVAVMIISVSIVTGFKKEIKTKVVGFGSEVSIHAANAEGAYHETMPILSMNGKLSEIIENTSCLSGAELLFNQPAILKTPTAFEGVIIRGIEDGYALNFISKNIISGNIDKFSEENSPIILSSHTADKLSLNINDRIDGAFFINNNVRMRRFTVVAIYNTYFSDYDNTYAFVPLATLQRLNHVDSLSATQIDLRVSSDHTHNPAMIEAAALSLRQSMMIAAYSGELSGTYRITDINQTGATYFNWLALLDTNILVILIIMALVSGFTLISSLFIIILQKVRTIGILKSMGASTSVVRKIFICIGWKIVLYGILIGDIIALTLLFVQYIFHIIPLDPDAYYLNSVPVNLNIWYPLGINVATFFFFWIVLLIPARTIASVSPASTMRYE